MVAKRVLVSVLNWGLGHATRCIPVVEQLIHRNHHVTLASDGQALRLLQLEFPQLATIELPGYRAHYQKKLHFLNYVKLASNTVIAYYRERTKLSGQLAKSAFDLILSDNRYGIYHPQIKSILITHQLNIPLPLIAQPVNYLLRRQIARFDECWIPDLPTHELSGDLSKADLSIPRRFIGPLSQVSQVPAKTAYEIVAIISGPEEQRSIFAKLVLEQLCKLPQRSLIILGKESSPGMTSLPGHVDVIGLAKRAQISQALADAKMVVCRSGYSSIMDISIMGKRALVIPTPGQPEQEYLGRLHQKREAQIIVQAQHEFDIAKAYSQVKAKEGQGSRASYGYTYLISALEAVDL